MSEKCILYNGKSALIVKRDRIFFLKVTNFPSEL